MERKLDREPLCDGSDLLQELDQVLAQLRSVDAFISGEPVAETPLGSGRRS